MNKTLTAIVEIPAGSKFKYEQDQDDLSLLLDRSLSVTIPENYGYIADTMSDDGDPLDVFILTRGESIVPLTKVKIQIVGGFECDDNGVSDPKILAILSDSDMDEDEIAERTNQVENYLSTYKEGFQVENELEAAQALSVCMKSKDKE